MPQDAQSARGLQPLPRAARISRKLDHPGISTPLLEMLALLIQISFLNTILPRLFFNQFCAQHTPNLRITLGE